MRLTQLKENNHTFLVDLDIDKHLVNGVPCLILCQKCGSESYDDVYCRDCMLEERWFKPKLEELNQDALKELI